MRPEPKSGRKHEAKRRLNPEKETQMQKMLVDHPYRLKLPCAPGA
jgi:hypothetical protein